MNGTAVERYEQIARTRQNEHLDGQRGYLSYLRAYEQYKRACAFYGATSVFVHILPPNNLPIFRSNLGYVTIPED